MEEHACTTLLIMGTLIVSNEFFLLLGRLMLQLLGSTPLHLAARSGSIDCIRELLAWGTDRLQRDANGRIPYTVALRHSHGTCVAFLNPSSAEPLVWSSSLKFISALNEDAKSLKEKNIHEGTASSRTNSDDEMDDNISKVSDTEVCCICFDQLCTIQVQDCGHQMCAHCILALCCHNKPNPNTTTTTAPVCLFCRSSIVQLQVIKFENDDDINHDIKSPKLRKYRRS